jgi:hypothetical protein
MAIDYSGYKEGFGGQGGLTSGSPLLAQGLSSALGSMPTAAQKLESNQMRYFSKLSNQLNPEFEMMDGKLQATAGTAIGGGLQSLPEAWKNYKETIGNRIRPNEFALFKEKYDALVAGSGTNLVQKFTAMTQSGVRNSTIREYLRANPEMRNTLVKLGMANPELLNVLSPYLSGGVGVLPGLGEKAGDIAMAGMGVPLIRGIGKAYTGFTGAAAGEGLAGAGRGFGRGITPGRAFYESRLAAGAKGIGDKALTKRLTAAGYDFGAKKELSKKSLSRENALKKAEEKFASAKKKYEFDKKGKKIKGKNFSATKDAKTLKKQIARRANVLKAGYTPKHVSTKTAKIAETNLKSYIKKNGMRSLISKVAKKIGWKGATKLGDKLRRSKVLVWQYNLNHR